MKNTVQSHRRIWKNKKILRLIYQDWYKKICRDLIPGTTLEIGSGTGNFKEFKKDVITSDIDPCPWLDMCFDAHKIPLRNKSVDNLVLIDALHHLSQPVKFFEEANRVLKYKGRIILLEPFPSPISRVFYRIFHPEPFNFNVDYFKKYIPKNKNPWEANQAIPYLLFFKQLEIFEKRFPDLKIIKREKLSFITYPLSGGYRHRSMIPDYSFPFFAILEKLLSPFKSILAFRCYLVMINYKHAE
jgi:SAM-dependent methyltransferase